MDIDNSLEEDLLIFWKKQKINSSNHKLNNYHDILDHPELSAIGIIIILVFILNFFIHYLPLIIEDLNEDYACMIAFLILILVILVITYIFDATINKSLFEARYLDNILQYLYKRNIKNSKDYENLINRLQSKLNKVEQVTLIDDSLSKSIIGVSSFIGGNIFTDFFKADSSSTLDMNKYLILLLASILSICTYKFIIISFNYSNDKDKDNLILLIDDLQKIKYQLEKEDSWLNL